MRRVLVWSLRRQCWNLGRRSAMLLELKKRRQLHAWTRVGSPFSLSDSHGLNLTKSSGRRIWEIQRAGILAWQCRVGDGGESAGLWADTTTTTPPLRNSYHIEVLRPAALICYDCWVVIKYKHHFEDEYWPSQLWNGEEFTGKLFLWFLTCSLAEDRGVDKQVQRGKKVRFQCFHH